jgi:hypothetical protein
MKMFIQNNVNSGNNSYISNSSGSGTHPIGFRSGRGFNRISMSVGYNSSIFDKMRQPGCSSCGK